MTTSRTTVFIKANGVEEQIGIYHSYELAMAAAMACMKGATLNSLNNISVENYDGGDLMTFRRDGVKVGMIRHGEQN